VEALTVAGAALTAAPVLLFSYAYVGYPALLRVLAPGKRSRSADAPETVDDASWPFITITLPAYNEEARITAALDGVLSADYPAGRRQVLVISDASTDRTDEIVRGYADRGVELVRLPLRRGKSAAENAAGRHARGEIIVNVDASVQLPRGSLRALVREFRDSRVGLASGRDISVAAGSTGISGESGYVGYEMGIRALETRIDSIVGASGCFYGIRKELYDPAFPEDLSRDFASALMVRQRGYRAVSAEDAVCLVPRAVVLRAELRRKVRTMARGLSTLWYMRGLMNPLRYGTFAFMLISHKLVRWLVYLALPGTLVGLAMLSVSRPWALAALIASIAGIAIGGVALAWPRERRLPRPLALAGFALASSVAGVLAWIKVMKRERMPTWEPTRRPA
jgi:cellulose synthase/poly-beta-1,6-N-acetylglucosamine synthase-like glycosyltransferase